MKLAKKITAKSAGKAALTEMKNNRARARMIGQFPEATALDIHHANHPPRKKPMRHEYENYSYAGDGIVRKVDAKPTDGFFKQAKLRHKHMTPRLKKVAYKTKIFPQSVLVNLFRAENISAKDLNGWHVYINEDNRKMTADDQVTIFLAHTSTEYTVHINNVLKYLIIDEVIA